MTPDPSLTPVVRFETDAQISAWQALGDRVMGGLSVGRLVPVTSEGRGARFAGIVSLAHGGGFASILSPPLEVSLAGCQGLQLLACGDGHAYKLCVRVREALDDVIYQARFTPAVRKWVEMRIRFADFVATRRGRVIDGAPLRGAAIRQVGLMISDRQHGTFALDIRSIDAFR